MSAEIDIIEATSALLRGQKAPFVTVTADLRDDGTVDHAEVGQVILTAAVTVIARLAAELALHRDSTPLDILETIKNDIAFDAITDPLDPDDDAS